MTLSQPVFTSHHDVVAHKVYLRVVVPPWRHGEVAECDVLAGDVFGAIDPDDSVELACARNVVHVDVVPANVGQSFSSD
jgi:hypothetical protein